MSRLDELTERMKKAVGSDSGLGKTLKFDLKGEGFVFINLYKLLGDGGQKRRA